MNSILERRAIAPPLGRFSRNAAVLVGGTGLAQGILVLASPFLTRLYAPEEMGLMGLYLSYFGFVNAAVSLRYETAIVSARDNREAAHLAFASMALALPSSVVFAGVLYALIRFSLLGFGHLPAFTAIFVIPSVLVTGIFVVQRYWFVREESLATVSKALVFQNTARSFLQVAFGALRFGWLGLIVGDVLGRAVGMGKMWRASWPAISGQVFPLRWKDIADTLRSHYKFPAYSLPSAVIDAMALSIPTPLVAALYGTAPAGHLSLVLRVLSLPLALVGTSVGDAFHGRLAAHVREEPTEAVRFFYRTAKGLLLVGLAPTILLMLFGGDLFRVVFGQNWALAGKMAAALAPSTLTQLVVSPLSRVVYVLQGFQLKLSYDILSLSVTVGSVVAGHAFGLSALHSIFCLSLANILANVVYFFILMRIVARSR